MISEGLPLRNRSGWLWQERVTPPDCEEVRRGDGLDGSAVFGFSPQPSGLPEPAGGFHRGATRGELVVTEEDDTDRYPARWILADRRGGWPVERCDASIPIES